jgi:hypothetical protein
MWRIKSTPTPLVFITQVGFPPTKVRGIAKPLLPPFPLSPLPCYFPNPFDPYKGDDMMKNVMLYLVSAGAIVGVFLTIAMPIIIKAKYGELAAKSYTLKELEKIRKYNSRWLYRVYLVYSLLPWMVLVLFFATVLIN